MSAAAGVVREVYDPYGRPIGEFPVWAVAGVFLLLIVAFLLLTLYFKRCDRHRGGGV